VKRKYWILGGILSVLLMATPPLLAQDDGNNMNGSSGSIDRGQPSDQMGSDMDQPQGFGDSNQDNQSAIGQDAPVDPADSSMKDPSGDGLQDNEDQLDSGSQNQNDQSEQSDQSNQDDSATDSGD
jgi:hypothetical protein